MKRCLKIQEIGKSSKCNRFKNKTYLKSDLLKIEQIKKSRSILKKKVKMLIIDGKKFKAAQQTNYVRFLNELKDLRSYWNVPDHLKLIIRFSNSFKLLSNDFDRDIGELLVLLLSVVGVKYKWSPYFGVLTIILFRYYSSTSSCKNAGVFGWFTFFNRSLCWYVSLFAFFNSYIINRFLLILSLNFWHC